MKYLSILFFIHVGVVKAQSEDTIRYSIPDISNYGSVRELHLLGKGYTQLDDRIFLLPNLRVLNLSSNKLRTLDARILKMRKLSVLNLAFNDLSILPDLGQINSLTEINIQGNLFYRIPSEIFENKGLRKINFDRQKYFSDSESVIPAKISQLSHLEVLIFNFCNLKKLPTEFFNLINLTHLSLVGNRLSYVDDKIGNLKKLVELNLAGNEEISILPNSFGSLANLTFLDLSQTSISKLPDSLFMLPNLRKIVLHNTPLAKNLNTLDTRSEFREKFEKYNKEGVFIAW